MSAARVWWWYLADAVAVLACAIALLASWQVHQRDEQLSANRSQVQQQAGPLVAQVFSIQPEDYEQDRGRARSLVTDEFAQQFSQILDPAVTPAPALSVTWTPVHTGITAVTSDHADAVVSATVTAGATRSTKVLDVRFERSGDTWKIARADEVL